jgi:hypothetical protein
MMKAPRLESRTTGKLLYAIQQVSATNRRIEQMEAAQLEKRKAEKEGMAQVRHLLANLDSDDNSRIHGFPEFDKQFGLPPGADLYSVTDAVLQEADDEAELRQEESMPSPPPGVRPGSPAYRVFREEAYQILRLQISRMQHELRDYNQQKLQQFETTMKKEMMSATPSPEPLAESA